MSRPVSAPDSGNGTGDGTELRTAPGSLYRDGARLCGDCGRPVDGRNYYCFDDRDRRRALTFLSQAQRILDPLAVRRAAGGGGTGTRAAAEHVRSAIEELAT